MIVRPSWLLTASAIVMAWSIIACAADPPAPSTAEPASSVTANSTASPSPPPVATVEPTATTTVHATAAPTATSATPSPAATSVPGPPAPTATSESQPTSVTPPSKTPIPFLIRLRDDLDDPLGYCIDVRGFGSGIRLDADLQAHSCKFNSPDDQSFALLDESAAGGIVLVEYGVCLSVDGPEPGASILLGPCDDVSALQQFEWLDDGRLQLLVERDPSRPKLCVGVADGVGEPAGGRNHLRRDLLLRDCADADPVLIAWRAEPNQ